MHAGFGEGHAETCCRKAVGAVCPLAKTIGKLKQPFLFMTRSRSRSRACGKETKDPKTGEVVASAAIITGPTQGVVTQLHDRMPIILAGRRPRRLAYGCDCPRSAQAGRERAGNLFGVDAVKLGRGRRRRVRRARRELGLAALDPLGAPASRSLGPTAARERASQPRVSRAPDPSVDFRAPMAALGVGDNVGAAAAFATFS